jgi:hypothetical protein
MGGRCADGDPQAGRRYTTLVSDYRTLPNGSVLVASASYVDPTRPANKQQVVFDLLQVWENGARKGVHKADSVRCSICFGPLWSSNYFLELPLGAIRVAAF